MRLLGLLLVLGFAAAAPPQDEIKALPGWNGPLPSRQWSGYLHITDTKHLHYWFVEATTSPATAPVVLWLNGGPGCSSLDGFIYEHGPFRLDEKDHTKLVPFEHAWTNVANMIYLESPVGVGFSYSDDRNEYRIGDDQTAEDATLGMEMFFKLFPEYKGNPFYLTGESYAGIYVPTLAEAILKKGAAYTGAKLLGIAVGNGCTGTELGVCGPDRTRFMGQFLAGQGFVPQHLKDQLALNCRWNSTQLSVQCRQNIATLQSTIGNINMYNIYGDCISGDRRNGGLMTHKAPMGDDEEHMWGAVGPNACIDSIAASAYFNHPAVQEAIHVKKPPFRWAVCANQITYARERRNLPRDTYPYLNQNIRVLIYNGDWDACVPYTDNEAWTTGMNYPVRAPWHPWAFNGNQVGGYATVYNTPHNFTFITVRGGRHEVPESAPRQALEMLTRFTTGRGF